MNLDMFYSKIRSPSEFKFDQLFPSKSLFSMIPIQLDNYLYSIAVNPRNSVKKKYELIDRAMSDYGFSKLARGTNRSVYQCLFADDLIVKVGVDKYGVQDARREYSNQDRLKPFCTKTFEVSPTGTIGLFEKVKPIIYKDEFRSIASDVFDLLVKHVLGKYILADIGASFYMNYGLRVGFGPVLLDYPYMYELDGTKIHCTNQVVVGNQKVKCDGLIDYDVTFDFLVCEKCGKKYLASDIAKVGSDNIITINPDMIGECNKMAGMILINGEVVYDSEGKVAFTEKPEVVKKIEAKDFAEDSNNTPTRSICKSFNKPQPRNVDVYQNRESQCDYYNRQISKVARDFLRRNMYDRHSLRSMVFGILSFIKYTDKSITFDKDLYEITEDYVEMILDDFEREIPQTQRSRQPEVFTYRKNNNRPQNRNNEHRENNNNRRNNNNNGYRQNNNKQNYQPKSQAYIPPSNDTLQSVTSANTLSEEPYVDVPNIYVGQNQKPIYSSQPLPDNIVGDEVVEPDYQYDYSEETKVAEHYSTIGEENMSRLQDVANRIDEINKNNQGPQDEDPLKKNKRDISKQRVNSQAQQSF